MAQDAWFKQIDNLLDTLATPAALIAGTVVTGCRNGTGHPILIARGTPAPLAISRSKSVEYPKKVMT